MLPFIQNIPALVFGLLTIITKVPAAVVLLAKVPHAVPYIMAIRDFLGSDALKKLLKVFYDEVEKEKTNNTPSADLLPPEERTGVIKRITRRIAQRLLGFSDNQMRIAMTAFPDAEKTADFLA